jgi:hypothetical protein
MPLQATSGAASYDAFGGGVPVVPNYIEEVFSTYLYTGNGTTNVITNNIDLSGKGGMVWMKSRSNTFFHGVYDTLRGTGTSTSLYTNTTEAQGTNSTNQNLTAFNADGFTLGATSSTNAINGSGGSMCSWTFRKQPKFFDVVTYTGNGATTQEVAHSLGSVPACIIVKCTNVEDDWFVYHRSSPSSGVLKLDKTDAANTSIPQYVFGNGTVAVAPTSTVFTVSGDGGVVNNTGSTYVAYLFAHNAGGFGLTGTDNVISCGSFTTDGAGDASVNLGYEPQWVMQKRTDSATGGNWFMADNMRGMTVDGSLGLFPNLTSVEDTSLQGPVRTNATGFTASRFANATYIYIAIRRGPMKVPTSGTNVFSPNTGVSGAMPTITTGFPVDLNITTTTGSYSKWFADRLRGSATNLYAALDSTSSNAEINGTTSGVGMQSNTGIVDNWVGGTTAVYWNFRRAPSFFDEVCYTGDNSATRAVNHNLAVLPEMLILKKRNSVSSWWVMHAGLTDSFADGQTIRLNNTSAASTTSDVIGRSTSTFTVKSFFNATSDTWVAYLFSSCAGVSKVGSYTGTGTTKQIDCGFTGGARFVLIKRSDSTGDWYVWDSARGIIAGDDPYLLLNTTGSEVTNTDYIDTYSAGFEISSTAPSAINASGGTFIFLAIA